MDFELLDESIMGIVSEVETSAFRLVDLQGRARGSISCKNGYLYRQWKEGEQWKYERIKEDPENAAARLSSLKKLYKSERDRLRRLNSLLARSGIFAVSGLPERILRLLAFEGIISKYGMIVGTFAFFAYQSALGFSLKKGLIRTSDMDLVRPSEMQAAVRDINLGHILERLKMPFRPDGPKGKIVRYVFENGFKIEVLYPHVKGRPQGVIPPERAGFIDIGAQELKFFKQLLKKPIHTVVTARKDPIPVTTPDPARFLLHKLVTSSLRNQPSKAMKDIMQASILTNVLMNRAMLTDVEEALPDFTGHKIEKHLKNGLKLLKGRDPSAYSALREIFKSAGF